MTRQTAIVLARSEFEISSWLAGVAPALRPRLAMARVTAVIGVVMMIALSPPATASEPQKSAESYLLFESTIDGRCHNLSEGGKLQILRNMHPTKKISFRLIRYFVEVRQRGRATGVAEPAGNPVKIGCTRVGGRSQRWVVERAEFTTADN